MPVDIRIIRTEADYEHALAEYERHFDAEPARGTPEADRFELLGLLLAKYEAETTPIVADPVETVKAVMEGRGYDRADLVEVVGSAARASDFLNRKRSLSLDQIRRLSRAWRIPADALIGETAVA